LHPYPVEADCRSVPRGLGGWPRLGRPRLRKHEGAAQHGDRTENRECSDSFHTNSLRLSTAVRTPAAHPHPHCTSASRPTFVHVRSAADFWSAGSGLGNSLARLNHVTSTALLLRSIRARKRRHSWLRWVLGDGTRVVGVRETAVADPLPPPARWIDRLVR